MVSYKVIAGVALAVLVAGAFAIDRDPGTDAPSSSTGSAGPLGSPATFRLAVVGDFGTGDSTETQIAQAMRKQTAGRPFDALLTTGDNIYPSGNPRDFDSAWKTPYGWIERRGVRTLAALGNHDVRTDHGAPVMDLFGLPSRWYSTRIRDVEIFTLDANDPSNSEQTDWLRKGLRRSKAAWQIVTFHQPAFSCSNHGSTRSIIENWVPIFEAEGADLVLNGHDHNYQRFKRSKGVTYIVTGGGGAPLYRLRSCPSGVPDQAVAREAHHFLVIVGNAQALRVRAFGLDGPFDRLLLKHRT